MTRARLSMRPGALLCPFALGLAVGAATAASAVGGTIERGGRWRGQRERFGALRALFLARRVPRAGARDARRGGADQKWASDLRVPRNSGRDLRGRRFPRRAQRGADRDRTVRQAQAELRILERSVLDVRTAGLLERGVRVQWRKPHAAEGARELLARLNSNPSAQPLPSNRARTHRRPCRGTRTALPARRPGG